jgi:hypothetical protein
MTVGEMAALWAAAALAFAGSSPHAQARSLYVRCAGTLETVRLVAVSAHSAALPAMVRTAREASDRCDLIQPLEQLVVAHPKDPALQSAFSSGMNLTLGLDGYTRYLAEAAFGRQTRAELRRAIGQIQTGRREATVALQALA